MGDALSHAVLPGAALGFITVDLSSGPAIVLVAGLGYLVLGHLRPARQPARALCSARPYRSLSYLFFSGKIG
jgi:ABC-type Mn2+/Zn2+ transport system permease subunit